MAKKPSEGICCICGTSGRLSFEHLPPRGAANDTTVREYSFQDWLERGDSGELTRGSEQQRGSGGFTLCQGCNNDTGSWYVPELTRWAGAGFGLLAQLPARERLDSKLDHTVAGVLFKGVRPLRFLKQVVTMLLSANGPDFGRQHPDLVDFVLDRHRTGLPDRYAFYLALNWGPMVRVLGVQHRIAPESETWDHISEITYPPFSYSMTIDTPDELLPVGNITQFSGYEIDERADVLLPLVIGFVHTPYPADYRTMAAVQLDREKNSLTKDFYTVAEVAEMLGVTTKTVYRMVKRGDMSYHDVGGGSRRFSREDVEEYLERSHRKRAE
jgi:excisionase family DNA binding protein